MSLDVARIAEQYQWVQAEIGAAARSGWRAPEDVTLVVVTKAHPPETLRAVIQAGAQVIGENYPEETAAKLPLIPERGQVAWHMIGHLQSRKAKLIVAHFDLLHSLDSLPLAEKLNRLLVEAGRRLPVLLEFNVGGEESKFGWDATVESRWPALLPEIRSIASLTQLDLQGLMTMPPLETEPQVSRGYFARLRHLRDFLQAELGLSLPQLSMGTSGDFREAVQEGSTLVRVGTAIVGPRPPRA
jgi:pyridoxal phosphate enzyme (YggS family)